MTSLLYRKLQIHVLTQLILREYVGKHRFDELLEQKENIAAFVLEKLKEKQANVITRREEVASTRSLLNPAKLMEENTTLYKLKELEYLEKICDKVGNISVGNGNLLGQLGDILAAR